MNQPISRILIAVDGSQSALRAVSFGAALARATGASMTLIHVHPTISAEVVGMAARSDSEMADTRGALASAAFAGVEEALGETRVPHERVLTFGDPAAEIIARAKSERVEMIVVGCRGMSPIKELLLGSVSSKLVHHAPCAVTVVR